MCPHCRAFITTDDKICPYCDTPVGPRAVDRRPSGAVFAGLIPHARFVTVMILLINTGLYIVTVLYSMRHGGSGMDLDGRTLFEFGAKYRDAILLGQWWRLVTAGFLHGGVLHILMNSWVLFDVGSQVEEFYGVKRYLVIYFVSTVCGFYASTWWSAALSIGASAGIMGLIGAMIALGVKDRSAFGSAVRSLYIRWAMYALVLGLLPGLSVDNAAHVGGVVSGFVVAYFAGTPGFSAAVERFWQIAAAVCVLATAYSFLQMFLWMSTTGMQ